MTRDLLKGLAAVGFATFIATTVPARDISSDAQSNSIGPGAVAPGSNSAAIAPDSEGAPSAQSKPQQGVVYLTPQLAEMLRLTRAGVNQDVIIAYIKNSDWAYNVDASEVVTLRNLGISPQVITALLERDAKRPGWAKAESVTAPAPAETGTPPTTMSYSEFFPALSPFGQWFSGPGLGWCWQPSIAAVNQDWQPYVDDGYWLWSNNGWYWNSGYSWGWAPFHHGRWHRHRKRGWVWTPGSDWAPSWVSSRKGKDYVGWASLPPGANFKPGTGWVFNDPSADQN